MSLKVWRGSLTWNSQCTMSATLTQGFQRNLISTRGEKSSVYVQLAPCPLYCTWGWHRLGQSQSCWLEARDGMITSQSPVFTLILSPGGKVAVCCKTENPFTLTGWMLVPSPPPRHHRAPRNPSVEKRESYFRGQAVCLAWHRDAFHPVVCLRGRKKKLTHAALVGTWIPDVKWNTYNFYYTVSWWISWSLECSADGRMRECSMNVGAGTVKAFAEPRPWLPGICPDESWTGLRICWSPPHPSFPTCERASVCMQGGHASEGLQT